MCYVIRVQYDLGGSKEYIIFKYNQLEISLYLNFEFNIRIFLYVK